MDILYLDFQKAFDSVPHRRLLKKLEGYGITGAVLESIKDFLANRTFQVKIGDGLSSPRNVPSGVPQGSVLGPLLFLIFINDLPDKLTSFASLFADDLKLINTSCRALLTQEDLRTLDKWQNDWLLRFNVQDQKCKVLHIGSGARPEYFLGEYSLPYTENERDLGVETTEKFSWDLQIRKAIGKARKTAAWVRRNLISRERFDMLTVYKTLVRPHLEYATQVWNLPATHGSWGLILDIEKVQREFTRAIEGFRKKTYKARLQELKLTTLLERRMRGDLIETFKICNGLVDYGKKLFRLTSHDSLRILKDKRGDKILANRVANYWNKLPASIKTIGENEKSINGFKSRLEKFKIDNLNRPNHYWELSSEIFSRINDDSRDQYMQYLEEHPAAEIKRNRN